MTVKGWDDYDCEEGSLCYTTTHYLRKATCKVLLVAVWSDRAHRHLLMGEVRGGERGCRGG